jgi:hypothetical protein
MSGRFFKAIKRVFGGSASAVQDSAKKFAKALDDSGGVINDDVMKTVKKNADNSYDLEEFAILSKLTKKNMPKNLPAKSVTDSLNTTTELAKDLPTGKMAKATASTLSETADALKSSDSFFKKNKKTLVAAGISAAGLGMYMLMTGETNPAKALGKAIGEVAGSGFDSFLDSSGLGDLFKGAGGYIIAFFAVIFVLFILYMFMG